MLKVEGEDPIDPPPPPRLRVTIFSSRLLGLIGDFLVLANEVDECFKQYHNQRLFAFLFISLPSSYLDNYL